MTTSSKSKRFNAQLKALDAMLRPSVACELGSPMAPKINEGSDRFAGYP